ncbi:conjugative transposon protein TraM [Niabella aurantiaca]|uniref:conjugative transposon protein TraM n=1 Tax=Niabella aurantiaca TaxID=379900 RepID=UPI000361463C|nr:conjugative transposon protein TraM [Niabella aurantiaca]
MEKKNEENGSPQYSAKFLRQRKFLLVAPVLVVPFLILLLWTTGLVGNAKAETKSGTAFQGLNLNLPSAAPAKDSNWNKLKYYEQADKDSAKLKSQLRSDPFYNQLDQEDEEPSMKGVSEADYSEMLYGHEPTGSYNKQDKNERKVYQKLARLQQEINREPESGALVPAATASPVSSDISRLENMMQQMQGSKEPDAELTQLNGMLEKVLDIQNPERVQEKIRQQSEQNKKQAFTVQAPQEDVVSVLESKKNVYDRTDSLPGPMRELVNGNRFYSLDEAAVQTQARRAISAMIPETQTLVSGATVKMRLLEDVYIAGIKVPKNHFVYGKATLNGERLQVTVSSIGYDNNILPVALEVYDKKDGLAGIGIKGAITRDVAKNSASQSLQGLGTLNTLDPSFGAQMATAGLNMAQNLVGRTAKLVRVTVEAGYPVLLKDDNQKDK